MDHNYVNQLFEEACMLDEDVEDILPPEEVEEEPEYVLDDATLTEWEARGFAEEAEGQ